MCNADVFLAFLAILFPPLSVWIKRGICSADSFINIALCMLGFLPGLLHAWYIIAKYPEDISGTYEPLDAESGRYNYDPHAQAQRARTHGYIIAPAPQHPQNAGGYSTFGHQSPQPQHSAQAGPSTGNGDANGQLPSYAEVVKGDFKVQTRE